MNFGGIESVQLAASRTCLMTSSSATCAATRMRGIMLARSRVTKETSASGATSGRSSARTVSLSMLATARCGLNRGRLAESSDVESARLLEMRVKGLTRGTSRSPTFVIAVMRMTWRAALLSVTGGRRSLLRAVARLRSKSMLRPPSTDSGGSLPRSIAPDFGLCESRAFALSNSSVPCLRALCARTAAPTTSIRRNRCTQTPGPRRTHSHRLNFTEVFSFAPIVYCVDRVTKPERRARYFPTRQDAARLWLECGGTDLCRDQGSDRHLRAKSGAGETAPNARAGCR